MKKVSEYTYFVEASLNENKNMIYMCVYERRETGNMLVVQNSTIPYIMGTGDIDILINKWVRTIDQNKMCNKWFLPAKEGFKEELKRLLKEI